MPREIETLDFADGAIKLHFERRTDRPTPILPKDPYIWIWYMSAEPCGKGLLRRHVNEVVTFLIERVGPLPILFHAASNPAPGDETAQEELEAYYLKCGLAWYKGSGLMCWPDERTK